MADSRYKEYNISKKVDVNSVVRKTFISRAQYEFEGGNPVTSGTLVLENIMGEEDVYRWDPEFLRRADNALHARIIWSSGVKASSKVYYSAVTETFNLQSALEHDPPETDGVVYHEIFLLGLDIDTEYAFQVESYDSNGDSLRSETYWFHTHGEILVEGLGIDAVVALAIQVIADSELLEPTITTSVVINTNIADGEMDATVTVTSAALDDTESFTLDEDQMYTELQTSVV